ncbi:MAG TPA: SPOR domain-containing protein [Paracoccaceae bacterium]|nr:SPOR domain-containing protein [Paracoccaceae bacterium]
MRELKAGQGARTLTVGLGMILVLSACQMSLPKFGKKSAGGEGAVETAVPGNSAAAAPAGAERDVEAPEVFKKTEKGLWDGRPSLGGVWVAHASVTDPERVIIRNPANGKSVIGALFRREFDNPGPSLQLSSDAAEALGLLAGQPTTIDVVALKRVEAPAPVPAPAAVAAPAVTTKPLDPAAKPGKPGKPAAADPAPVVATAAAAIDKAAAKGAGTKPAAAAPAPAPAPATAAPAGTIRQAYVQIGIFSVEANAKKAAAQMQKAGMTATVKADTSQGKSFWRVIVGPAASVADRAALVAKVKGLGYPDAYPVSK